MREASPPTRTPSPRAAPGALRIIADNVEELAAAALLCVIGLSMGLQVFLRSLFGAPLSWPEELSQFLFVWASALGAVGAAKRGSLVRLEFVAEKVPPALRAALDYLVLAGIIALLGVLFWKGWELAGRTSFAAATLPLTWAWAYAAAPVFAALTVLRLLQLRLFRYRFVFVETLMADGGSDATPREGRP